MNGEEMDGVVTAIWFWGAMIVFALSGICLVLAMLVDAVKGLHK
jgi:hypothetical protein